MTTPAYGYAMVPPQYSMGPPQVGSYGYPAPGASAYQPQHGSTVPQHGSNVPSHQARQVQQPIQIGHHAQCQAYQNAQGAYSNLDPQGQEYYQFSAGQATGTEYNGVL